MKLILDIRNESKVPFIMEFLKNLSYVKTKPLNDEKALLIEDIREAVEEMKLVKSRRIKARPIEDLLNEL